MKKILIFILSFIIGYCIAQPNCGNNCTTCPGMKVCDTMSCICQNSTPIQLLSFKGYSTNNIIKLEWITSTENNNDYFVLEQSTDCLKFKAVNLVSGSGNLDVLKHYYSTDYTPYHGLNYYRLKQIDYNGRYSYSDIIAVQWIKVELIKVKVFNIAGSEISILDVDNIYLLVNYYSDGSTDREVIQN